MKSGIIKLSVILAYGQMLTVNALANALPINGKTTGALSDQLANLFTPQGFTFAIWGLIYTLLLVFVIGIAVLPLDSLRQRISQWFVGNTLLNSAWIFAWHFQWLFLSLLIMLGLLYTLIRIQLQLKKLKKGNDLLLLSLPFAVYFGWITVATIANTTAVLIGSGWAAWGVTAAYWTVAVLLIGLGIALSQLLYFKKIAYAAAILWGYWGIYSKHTDAIGFDNQYPLIVNTVQFCLLMLLLAMLGTGLARFRKKKIPTVRS